MNDPDLAQVEEEFTAIEVVHDEVQSSAILESGVQFHQERVGGGLRDLLLPQCVLHLVSLDELHFDHLSFQHLHVVKDEQSQNRKKRRQRRLNVYEGQPEDTVIG